MFTSAVPVFASGSKPVSEAEVNAKLSRVPFFAITTSDGDSPFFTSVAKNGSPEAIFFSTRKDAMALLPQVRKSDPGAIVSPVGLDRALALVVDPNESESGGVFRLQSTRRAIVNANGITGRDLKFDREGKIPLFFDRRVALPDPSTVSTGLAAGGGSFPLFFSLESLEHVYEAGLATLAPEAREAAGPLVPEVTSLDRAVSTMLDGNVENAASFFFLSRETFDM